ncbi:MAG TPA: thiol:disulfide interchange protein [Hellea balneolensis]|uniref:Thiol:disulfide interchange protein n=1 Tax=Hellea balneolensis TaxID=287478 RepID=A0A7C5LVH5_9PROT|nr:thiol:disulfide interchange protein [Hellea balneolensis]
MCISPSMITKRIFQVLICLYIALAMFSPAEAAETPVYKSGRASVQLVSTHDVVQPGQDIYLALSFRLEPHWHTYWRNAGGPGNPVDIRWEIPQGAKVGPFIWPLPIIVHTGPIVNYAFEDRLLLPMPFHVPENVKPGEELKLNAEAAYLVCYQVCLPEMANLTLSLKVGDPVIDGRWDANIKREIAKAPKSTTSIKAGAALSDQVLKLDFAGPFFEGANIRNPYFFPYEQDLINADQEQKSTKRPNGLTLEAAAGFLLEDGLEKDVAGVLALDIQTQTGWVRKGFELTAKKGKVFFAGPSHPKQSTPSLGLVAAIFGAFLGGLILNLMPCVFPVLSMKALGFAKTAHADPKLVRTHGWLYTMGVIISFLTLAGLLLILKSAGAGLGWGFQLQNPVLVAALSLLFLLVALNLFGMFEFGGRLQNAGAGLSESGGHKGAFFTGVLAVVVASPCTAPFMAGALGFAFTQSAFVTLVIFLSLAIGFALPFLALSHAPGLLNRLPKPGAWMDTFKQALAFPMLATSIWLVWVLTGLTGADGLALALLAMLLVVFAIWLHRHGRGFTKALAVISVMAGLAIIGSLKVGASSKHDAETTTTSAWSRQAVADARAEGHVVFVDFTADWCVTCKVNEKLFLNRKSTRDLFKANNVKVLIADWTRKDEMIAAELARHGRSGVPLYLVYPPGKAQVKPAILPQTLSKATLERAIKAAASK